MCSATLNKGQLALLVALCYLLGQFCYVVDCQKADVAPETVPTDKSVDVLWNCLCCRNVSSGFDQRSDECG